MKHLFLILVLLLSMYNYAQPVPFNTHLVDEEFTNPSGAHVSKYADLNEDGHVDIISTFGVTNDDFVVWYAGDGDGGFGSQQIIDSVFDINFPSGLIELADLNGDGHIDVVYGAIDNFLVNWYANDGLGNFSPAQAIVSSYDVSTIHTVDWDTDGDIDLITTNAFTAAIDLFLNDGSGNFDTGTTLSFFSAFNSECDTADLDGDGDLDLIITGWFDNDFSWFANDGSGNLGSEQSISSTLQEPRLFSIFDIDDDSDLDLAVASFDDDRITIFLNDGSGNFSLNQTLMNLDGAYDVEFADIDDDGNIDIVSASALDNTVAWFPGTGSGTFDAKEIIDDTVDSVFSISVTDIDEDGLMDIISSAITNNRISWHENLADDIDEDGIPNTSDNCPETFNPDQDDVDGDTIGDACDDGDYDGDGFSDENEYAAGTSTSDSCDPLYNAGETGYDGTNAIWRAENCDGDASTNGEEFDCGRDPYDANEDCILGIEENILNSITIFPNPTNGKVNVSPPSQVTIISMYLYDATGKLIRDEIDANEINLSDIHTGFYFIKIETTEGFVLRQIIKE